MFGPFRGSWDDYFELFKNKGLSEGDWLHFNSSYWEHRSKENILFITYEDMQVNLGSCIKKLASFINVPCTEDEIDKISNLVDFRAMKQNIAVNLKNNPKIKHDMDFIRKGKVGSWKDVFTVEQSEYIDSLYAAEIQRLGLPIVYNV